MDITLLYLLPELILCAFALIVIVLDLIWRERGESLLNWIAILGFVASLVATYFVWYSLPPAGLFCGPCFTNSRPYPLDPGNIQFVKDALYVSDYFTSFFRVIASLTGLLVLFLSFDYMRGRTRYRGEFLGIFSSPSQQ